jgi:regulator-associated protein of mTOR
MVCNWQQNRGVLIVSGDVKVIKIWDVTKELCVVDIATRVNSSVTSITSDQTAGDIFIASFDDGVIRVYDRRRPLIESCVMAWTEHKSRVIDVHMQRGGNRELVSGSAQGVIKLWDIRSSKSLRTIEAHSTAPMTSLVVHDSAPVVASGSENHYIKLWNMNGAPLSTLRPTTGFLGQYVGPVSSLAFHPHQAVLAAGGDSHISIYECNTKGPSPHIY